MMEIQEQLSQRAIELLALPDDTPCFVLDVGLVECFCITLTVH